MPLAQKYQPENDRTLIPAGEPLIALNSLDAAIRILHRATGEAMGGNSLTTSFLCHAALYLDAQYTHIYVNTDYTTRDVADALRLVEGAAA